MAIYSQEEKQEHKEIVRRVITMNPTISIRAMVARLKKAETPLDISVNYAMELIREVRQDRVKSVEDETKEDIYAMFKDTVDFVNQQLRAIAQEEKLVYTKTKDGVPVEKAEVRIYAQNNRIKAMNSIIDNLKKLFDLKMDLGIIERKVGTMDHAIIDTMAALKKIRNGNYTTPIDQLITTTATPVTDPGANTTG